MTRQAVRKAASGGALFLVITGGFAFAVFAVYELCTLAVGG